MQEKDAARKLLALAESCGATLAGKPDGSEAIAVNFSVDAWRAFSRAVSAQGEQTEPEDELKIGMKVSEWRSLSPEAQARLMQITGAGTRARRLADAQAAQDMRNKVLLAAPVPAQPEAPNPPTQAAPMRSST